MKTITKAFLELGSYVDIAQFADPDEAQGAEQVIAWCLGEASDEELALLREVASQLVAEARAEGAPQQTIDFFERFAHFQRFY